MVAEEPGLGVTALIVPRLLSCTFLLRHASKEGHDEI